MRLVEKADKISEIIKQNIKDKQFKFYFKGTISNYIQTLRPVL